MPHSVKRTSYKNKNLRSGLKPATYGTAAFLSLLVVVLTVLITRFDPPKGLGNYTGSATQTYNEDFTTTAYQASGTASAWDTARGVLTLPRTSSGFYNADEVTPGIQTVFSATATIEQPVAVEYDSLGQPYVAFLDHEAGPDINGIKLAHWDRQAGAWVKMDGQTGFDFKGNTSQGGLGSMDLLSTDEPALVWADLTGSTFTYRYTRWSNEQQTFVKLDGTPGSDVFFTGAIGGPVGSSGQRPMDLVHDSQDRPHIAFGMWDSTGSDSEIGYTYWDGSAWSTIGSANVSNNTGDALFPSGSFDRPPEIVLDSLGKPYVIWIDDTPGNEEFFLVYGDKESGVWRDMSGAAYSEGCLATTCSGVNLSQTASYTGSGDVSMSVNDEPMVAWSDDAITPTVPEVYYQRWNKATSTWRGADGSVGPQRVTTSPTGFPGNGARDPQVRLDTRDYPVISYESPDALLSVDVFMTRWNGSTFVTVDRSMAGTTNITNDGSTGLGARQPRMELDGIGNPGIIWRSATGSSILEFTRFVEPCDTSATVSSKTVLSSTEPIVAVDFDASETPYGGTITYELSNDGGQTFAEVQPGTFHTFATVGSDIKWRISMTRGSTVGACPVVQSLSIDASSSPVIRIDGDTPDEQSINVSKIRFPEPGSAPVGIIARNDIFADALTISPLVNRTGGTILLNDKDVLLPEVLAEFERALGTASGKTIYIAGQTQAQSAAIEGSLSEAGFETMRLGDEDRIGTAARIAEQIVALNPTTTTKVFVAEHALFADALVAGAVAGDIISDDIADPILLTVRNDASLAKFSRDFLAAHPDVTTVEIIGGEAALPAGLVTSLQGISSIQSIDRSAGEDRFATAAALMQKHVNGPSSVVIANGQKSGLPGSGESTPGYSGQSVDALTGGFFNALLAGPYSADSQAALLLTQADELPTATATYISDNAGTLTRAVLVGSLDQISQAVEDEIANLF